MKRPIYAGLAAFILVSFMAVSGCAPLNPEGAECRGLLYRQCDITDGDYAGLATGMTYQEAFSAVCRSIEEGRFSPGVVGSTEEGAPLFFRRPFCEQDVALLETDYWYFKQLGSMRDVGISVHFQDGQIVELRVGYSGLDP